MKPESAYFLSKNRPRKWGFGSPKQLKLASYLKNLNQFHETKPSQHWY
jgi:hypothetical protein